MSESDEIVSHIPMASIAAKLGVDEKTAEQAVRQALPALLGGMHANAQDPKGAESLSRALGKHDGRLVEGGVDLDDVDPADGRKIVSHVFGANEDQVVSRLGGSTGVDKGLIAKLLPLLAPIVMSWLAKKFTGGTGGTGGPGSGGSAQKDSGGLGGGLGDLLGGLLGGKGGSQGGLGGGLGDLLGGLLGGGRR